VVFVGNVYSQARVQLVQHLYKIGGLYNLDIGFYGRMYPQNIPVIASTHYDYATTHEIYRRAKMVIGTMEFADTDGYVSDRLFECLHAGGLLLQQKIINAQNRLGLVDGLHYLEWDTFEELTERVQWVLKNPEKAQEIARQGKEFVDEYHNWDVRVTEFWDILEGL
jgi:spore maturation protein CgeB